MMTTKKHRSAVWNRKCKTENGILMNYWNYWQSHEMMKRILFKNIYGVRVKLTYVFHKGVPEEFLGWLAGSVSRVKSVHTVNTQTVC